LGKITNWICKSSFYLFFWELVICRQSNMLYVESPISVGLSYSNTSSDYILLENC
jgi:hypothetical protein